MHAVVLRLLFYFLFSFHGTATTELSTLSLHDALPISTERKASEAAGTISASPYSVRATEMFSGLRKPVPSRPGSSTNNGRDGIAYISPERVVTPLRSQPMRLASLASGRDRAKAIT